MKALLWKDYHVSRPIFVFGAVLLMVPYLIVAIVEFLSWRRHGASMYWAQGLAACAEASLLLSTLTIAAIAGNAFAGERSDRSAEFLGYLPVSHARVVGSKLSVALAAVSVLWLVNLAVLYGLAPWIAGSSQHVLANVQQIRADKLPTCCGITALTFGAGWLASALLTSAAISTGLALAAPAVLAVAVATVADLYGLRWDVRVDTTFNILCVALGLVTLGLGSFCYLRRVEP